jgi:HSP20 family molecular chaperone IbpA
MREPIPSTKSQFEVSQLEVTNLQELAGRIQELHNSIRHRAYELFEQGGHADGHADEHWLQAENELLLPVTPEISETEDAVRVRAEVPGFEAGDLRVSVEPRRLAIFGERNEKKDRRSEGETIRESIANRIYCEFDLPADVDPARARSSIRHGVLEVNLPKASAVRQLQPRAAAASKVA